MRTKREVVRELLEAGVGCADVVETVFGGDSLRDSLARSPLSPDRLPIFSRSLADDYDDDVMLLRRKHFSDEVWPIIEIKPGPLIP